MGEFLDEVVLDEHLNLIDPVVDTDNAKSYFNQFCNDRLLSRPRQTSPTSIQMTDREVRRPLAASAGERKYKDQNGQWKYWALERTNQQQRQRYYTLMDMVRESEL